MGVTARQTLLHWDLTSTTLTSRCNQRVEQQLNQAKQAGLLVNTLRDFSICVTVCVNRRDWSKTFTYSMTFTFTYCNADSVLTLLPEMLFHKVVGT